jgi:cold shock CspA family protein
MGRSQASSAKKEKESKKLQKRKEKDQRREERKANSMEGRPLEDMLAYVDEYGNIVSTPPDPSKKPKIAVDDIVIGARKQDNTPDVPRTGKVTFFNTSKGYGFIKDSQSQESIFVHSNSLRDPIKENDTVSFEVQSGPKGLAAVDVRKVK